MRLLLGVEMPVSGAVYYDNRDLQMLDLRSVRRNIGAVLQNSRLFTGDIYSNIVISAPWLTLSDAWEAAKMAGVDEDIRKMPMGMQTLITEGGGGISGGQRQRVSLARAFLKKAPILVLDEATASLDMKSEEQIQKEIERLASGRTTFIIAHRFSTIRMADRILVLEKGRVVADGTHEELMASSPLYRELYNKQQMVAEEEGGAPC